MSRLRGWSVAAVAAAGTCGCNRIQSALAPAGDQARDIGTIWELMLWICGSTYLLVLVALAFAMLRGHGDGHRVAGERTIERGLAGWVLLIAGLLTVLTAASFAVDRRLHATPENPLKIQVTAKQWWWQVDYLDPDPSRHLTTANELRLPRDRPAEIQLRSADVIHSLWIPALAGKEDLIPGRENRIVMTPRQTGDFRGQCAEFCGLQHAKMALDVQVLEPAAFAQWRNAQLAPATSPVSASARHGERVFVSAACALCHRIRGTSAGGVSGPELTHLASRRTLAAGTLKMDRGTLAAWLADPQAHKPGVDMPAVPMSARDREALVDYLMGLR